MVFKYGLKQFKDKTKENIISYVFNSGWYNDISKVNIFIKQHNMNQVRVLVLIKGV